LMANACHAPVNSDLFTPRLPAEPRAAAVKIQKDDSPILGWQSK
jgi:hypothetical protein